MARLTQQLALSNFSLKQLQCGCQHICYVGCFRRPVDVIELQLLICTTSTAKPAQHRQRVLSSLASKLSYVFC
jgi:hypothetical protein